MHLFGYTLVPNPFWGGALFPLLVFVFLFAWPSIERRLTGDHAFHNVLERPRDNPRRTAIGAAFFTCLAVVFFAGSADRVFVEVGLSYTAQVWIYRIAFFVAPTVAFFLAKWIAGELRAGELHPFRGVTGSVVRRTPRGGFEAERRRPD